jgi:hypothetical protein
MICGTGDASDGTGALYPGKCALVRPLDAIREWKAFGFGPLRSSCSAPAEPGRTEGSADPGLWSSSVRDFLLGREKFEGSKAPLIGSDCTLLICGSLGSSGTSGRVGDVAGESSVSVSALRLTSRLESGTRPWLRRLPRLYVVRVDRLSVPIPPPMPPGMIGASPSIDSGVGLRDMLIRLTIAAGSSTMCSSSCRFDNPPFGWFPERFLSSRSAPSL